MLNTIYNLLSDNGVMMTVWECAKGNAVVIVSATLSVIIFGCYWMFRTNCKAEAKKHRESVRSENLITLSNVFAFCGACYLITNVFGLFFPYYYINTFAMFILAGFSIKLVVKTEYASLFESVEKLKNELPNRDNNRFRC